MERKASSISSEKKVKELRENLIFNYLIINCSKQTIPIKTFLETIEKDLIKKTLKFSKGNQKIASTILGIKPTTLNEKIKKFNISEFKKVSMESEIKKILEEIDPTRL